MAGFLIARQGAQGKNSFGWAWHQGRKKNSLQGGRCGTQGLSKGDSNMGFEPKTKWRGSKMNAVGLGLVALSWETNLGLARHKEK